jgi:HK97 family phage prohead protease
MFVVLTSGISLEFFKKNPVMLLNHDKNKIMGKWENIRIEGTQLLADAVFDEKDAEAIKMYEKVEQGMLNCVSIGFELVEVVYGAEGFEDNPVVVKCTLKEASLTPVPANESALRVYDKDGQVLSSDQLLTILSKNQNPISMKKLSFFVAALQVAGVNLSNDASEDDVLKAVQKLSKEHAELSNDKTELETKNTELTGKLKTITDASKAAETKKIETLVDDAITAKKLTADKREQFIKLATADFDTTKSILEGMKGHTSLSSVIETGGKGEGASKFADWDYKRLHRENPTELARIKAEEPERYKELYNAAYKTA